MLKLNLVKKGFTVEMDGKVLFEQMQHPDGKVWNAASIKKMGDGIFQNYLGSFYKESIKGQIRDVFASALRTPLKIGVNSWDVNIFSFQQLSAEIQLSTNLKSSTVDFYDSSNVLHVLPLAEAGVIAQAVGVEYKKRLAAKQANMATLEAARTVKACTDLANSMSAGTPGVPGSPQMPII